MEEAQAAHGAKGLFSQSDVDDLRRRNFFYPDMKVKSMKICSKQMVKDKPNRQDFNSYYDTQDVVTAIQLEISSQGWSELLVNFDGLELPVHGNIGFDGSDISCVTWTIPSQQRISLISIGYDHTLEGITYVNMQTNTGSSYYFGKQGKLFEFTNKVFSISYDIIGIKSLLYVDPYTLKD